MKKISVNLFVKGILLVSLPLLFMLVQTLLLYRAQIESAEASFWETHTKDVIQLAEKTYIRMTESHNATRGVLLVRGDPVYEKQAEEGSKGAFESLDELYRLVSDKPSQQQQVLNVRTRMQMFDEWLKLQRERVARGEFEIANDDIRKRTGAPLNEAYKGALQTFIAAETAFDKTRSEKAEAARRNQRWTLWITSGITLVVSGAAVYAFGRGVARRLSLLTQNAARIAEGQTLLPKVGGSDEIAVLDDALHSTSAKLAAAAAAELELKMEIEHRAEDLGRANESLRQQTQENEMFVYSVSHDLRSPLVNLQGFSKELEHAGVELGEILADPRVPADVRSRTATIIKADVMDSVRFIQNAVSRSAAIIDALLRLSRAGRIEYRHARVDLGVVARRVVDAMRSTIEQRQATVVLQPLLPVWGDPTAVDQIFANLIGNAVNYLDAKRPGHVEVGMMNEGQVDEAGLRTYYVRDNGLGIPEAHLNKVFVAFQRLHGDVARGEGIGLALVRRIIERHGGRASVESKVGVGTTFFVSLPGRPAEGDSDDKQSAPSGTKEDDGRDKLSRKARSYVMSPAATAAAAAEDQAARDRAGDASSSED